MKRFFEDAELAKACAVHKTTDAGHGRIEERECRATDAIDWLKERHPDWQGLRGIAAITAKRIDKKTGQTSLETRFYITSLPAGPRPDRCLQATEEPREQRRPLQVGAVRRYVWPDGAAHMSAGPDEVRRPGSLSDLRASSSCLTTGCFWSSVATVSVHRVSMRLPNFKL